MDAKRFLRCDLLSMKRKKIRDVIRTLRNGNFANAYIRRRNLQGLGCACNVSSLPADPTQRRIRFDQRFSQIRPKVESDPTLKAESTRRSNFDENAFGQEVRLRLLFSADTNQENHKINLRCLLFFYFF